MNDRKAPAPVPLALRPKDAAKALGIGQRKLWELTKAGDIPHVKVGTATLYPVDELRAWLKREAGKAVRE
jgi:excisionase family DNA binding protein